MRYFGLFLVLMAGAGAGGAWALADYLEEPGDTSGKAVTTRDADAEMAAQYRAFAAGHGDEASAPGTQSASAKPAKGRYQIVGVGDVMAGSDWPSPYMDDRMQPGGDPADVLGSEIAALFKGADVTFGNFEGTMHASSAGAKACGNPSVCYTFRSPVWHADYLKSAGFTLMSNANNHARDFGEGGRSQTYANLTGAGIAVSGGDSDATRFGFQTLSDGTKVALVAFGHNPGLMKVQELARARSLIAQAQGMADMVIVSCHIGAEGSKHERLTRAPEVFLGEDRGNPFAFARNAVDAGADVVLCHGPHVTRAVEVYKGRFIAYSLGNFWTYGRFNLSGINGYAPIADLTVGRDGALISARIVSALQSKPGGPRFDPSHSAAQFMATQTARDLPESNTRIAADGTISWGP